MKETQSKKKKYESPKLVRVVLNHDQAILAGCSTSTVNLSNTTGSWCFSSCRRQTSATAAQSASRS